MDWVKVSKTRRQRGYAFEDKVRGFFNRIDGEQYFHCRRLGGSSTGLPDLVITYNHPMAEEVIIAMECKSVKDRWVAEIPADQIYRCIDTLKVLEGGYRRKYVGFGFKFGVSEKQGRKKNIERYWLLHPAHPVLKDDLIKATYDIRTEKLKLYYKTSEYRLIQGELNKPWYPDIYRLADAIDPSVNHNERQIKLGRKQGTATS